MIGRNADARGSSACSHAVDRRGFTLIEVLVVVAIIGLLVSILIPSLSKAREQSRRVVCGSNLHQHLFVILTYSHDYRGAFPRNPSQHLTPSGNSSWWIDTVVATYDGASGGRDPFDLRRLFKRYTGGLTDMFSCPSNGGPKMDDPANVKAAAESGYMGGQVMMLWNSTCVFKDTSVKRPWAPRHEWREGGAPSGVPVVQDELTASGGTLTAPDLFLFNHGKSAGRSVLPGVPSYTNYRTANRQGECAGANTGYLDGHVNWTENRHVPGTSRWTFEVPFSQSATRVGGSVTTSGVPFTVYAKLLTH
jgi:prepilin-type N-terminal cleavage/methylation domain-containing protein/prepilin-type processing-associated H-X9-DG protein